MKSFKEMRTQIVEVLSKSDPIEKWISDFVHSKDPKFDGKSKEERIKMAKGAYYGSKKEGVMQPNGTDKVGRIQEDTVTYTHEDTGAKMKSKNLKEGENKQMKGKDPCWKGYQMVGTKKKNGKEVPNCVPEENVSEADIPLRDKEKNKMLSNKDKGTLGKIHSLMAKQKQTNKKPKDWAHALAAEETVNELNKSTLKSYSDKAFKSQDKAEAEYDHDHFDSGH